jgi:hypothetical protein
MVVDRRDLPRLLSDDHHLPVLPEKDGVAHIAGGIEAHAVEVAVRFGSETSRQTRGRRALGPDGMLAEDLERNLGEVQAGIPAYAES